MEGIATTLTTWNPGRARSTSPPRAVFTKLNRGATLGEPHDHAQQRRILKATLDLLAQDAPLEPITLEESAE
jgi:hypothetical protein